MAIDNIKLSTIIPYYKTYDLTKKLLDRLVPQLTNEVEIILVDDGCNELRLDEYKDKIKVIHLKENGGGAKACNVGIKESKGKYIGFIDSDDMVDVDYIKTLIEAIDNHVEDVIFMDWQDISNGVIVHHPNNYAAWKAIYKREITPLYKEGVRFSFDVPFYDELNSKPYTKYYIDKVLYYYNSNREGNLTSIKEKVRRSNMIKCEVIKNFDLASFNQLVDIKRKRIDKPGKLFVGDTFKCEKELAEYLMGKNSKNVTVVKILEVEPEIKTISEKDMTVMQKSSFDEAVEKNVEIKARSKKIKEIEKQAKLSKKKK